MTILRAQVEANERGLCHCGRRATSELSYAEEMDQRQDASSLTLSSPSPASSPPTDGSYQTPVTESVGQLIPVPEDVQLPSLTSSEEGPIPVPPPRATTPGREVSGQHCWTRCKFDKAPGAGASGRLFWRSSGLRGKDCARPYPAGRGEARGSAGDWRLRDEQHAGPSELTPASYQQEHVVTNWHFSRSFHFLFYCIDTCCYSPKVLFQTQAYTPYHPFRLLTLFQTLKKNKSACIQSQNVANTTLRTTTDGPFGNKTTTRAI